MPELDLRLAEPPAEQHATTADLAGIVDESHAAILELNAEVFELALIAVDLAGQRLRVAFELLGALTRLLHARRRRDQVELENLLAPHAMLPNDVFHDTTHERERLVRFVYREEVFHEREDTVPKNVR